MAAKETVQVCNAPKMGVKVSLQQTYKKGNERRKRKDEFTSSIILNAYNQALEKWRQGALRA